MRGFVFVALVVQFGSALGLVAYYFARLRGGD